MSILPKIQGLHGSGDLQEETAIFFCSNCQTQKIVKSGKKIPKCPTCKEYTYWIKTNTIT